MEILQTKLERTEELKSNKETFQEIFELLKKYLLKKRR